MDSRSTGDDDRQHPGELKDSGGASNRDAAGGDDVGGGVVIPVTFGTGPSRDVRGRHQTTEPDLSGDIGDEELLENPVIELTPRQRRFVEVAAWTLADDIYDAIEDMQRLHESAFQHLAILGYFPSLTWTQPVTWWRQQARCFDDLAIEAQTGNDPEPVCTGEEMALHVILGRARALATDDPDMRLDLIGGIAAHDNDNDWDAPLDFLFQDHDVLTLFDDDLEPITGAVNLVPDAWFAPFADSQPRTPDRGFRR